MVDAARQYHAGLMGLMCTVRATNAEREGIGFFNGIERAVHLIMDRAERGNKILFIGNGASAAISSHMAADFLKNGEINAQCFNDGPLLTCMGNDYGYRHVFERPIEIAACPGDVLVAISSSGNSENIVRGVRAGRMKGCSVITMSGFDDTNPLVRSGDINFHVPSFQYGPVEIVHQFIIHCILDIILEFKAVNRREENRLCTKPEGYLSRAALAMSDRSSSRSCWPADTR
jgi:D-sedoheptulose 7-phosphate isomerase